MNDEVVSALRRLRPAPAVLDVAVVARIERRIRDAWASAFPDETSP